MNVFAFVMFWVVLAIAVLLVALSGGSKGSQNRFSLNTRRSRLFAYTGFGIGVALLAVVVPGAVVAAVEDRNDIPKADVFNLTNQEKDGRILFGERCANCHTLKAANAVAQVGPNLDQLRPPKSLVQFAIANGFARGNGQMAPDLVQGKDAEAVAAFVAKAVGQTQ